MQTEIVHCKARNTGLTCAEAVENGKSGIIQKSVVTMGEDYFRVYKMEDDDVRFYNMEKKTT